MTSIEQIKQQLDAIQARNKRVEADKAWETSWSRKLLIAILTYIVVVLFFFAAELPEPFINAIVPSLGFVISTSTVPFFKRWWIKKNV